MELRTDDLNPNETEQSGHIAQCDGITNIQLYRVSAYCSARSLRWPNLAVGCGCFIAVYLPKMQWSKNSRLSSLNIHYFNVYFFNLYLLCKCGKRNQCEINRFLFTSLPNYLHKITGRTFSNSSSSSSINKFLQLSEDRCLYLERLSFYLLAFQRLVALLRSRNLIVSSVQKLPHRKWSVLTNWSWQDCTKLLKADKTY